MTNEERKEKIIMDNCPRANFEDWSRKGIQNR